MKEEKKRVEIEIKIDQIEARIRSGIITNDRTLKYKKRELKLLKQQLEELNRTNT